MGVTRQAVLHLYDKCRECSYYKGYGKCLHENAERGNQMCYWKRRTSYKDAMSVPQNCPLNEKTHELKILPQWFEDVVKGKKNFEIRKNDRDFKVGDKLLLKEYTYGRFTGREVTKRVMYVYHGDGTYGLSPDYCILGLK